MLFRIRQVTADSVELRRDVTYSNWSSDVTDAEADRIAALPRQLDPAPFPLKSKTTLAKVDLQEGAPAPTLTGVNLAGDSVNLAPRNAVLFFSFIACQPCAMALDQLHERGWRLEDGARVVYVNASDESGKVDYYVKSKYGAEAFDVMLVDRDLPTSWGVSSFPTFVVVDGDGIVRDIHSGYASTYVETLLE